MDMGGKSGIRELRTRINCGFVGREGICGNEGIDGILRASVCNNEGLGLASITVLPVISNEI